MSDLAKWYAVHTYSGYENKVATSIENAVENRRLGDLICEVRVPTETVTEIKDSKKREVERKLFPGYVLIKMVMNDETWYVVRNIRGVTGFVGPGSKPVPLADEEIARLGVENPEVVADLESRKIVLDFKVGDNISVVDGYLAGFIGRVDHIDKDKGQVKVTVSMMGRDTSAELSLEQVASLG
jgi:transcriptional antiterminator NusG